MRSLRSSLITILYSNFMQSSLIERLAIYAAARYILCNPIAVIVRQTSLAAHTQHQITLHIEGHKLI